MQFIILLEILRHEDKLSKVEDIWTGYVSEYIKNKKFE